MGVQMLVSDYLDQVIKSRPYKYSTKQFLIRDIRFLGIADLHATQIALALTRGVVISNSNHNLRSSLESTCRSISNDLRTYQDF